MAKKKIEKVREIVNYDKNGNIVTQKLTGETGGYTRETTPALVGASKTVEPKRQTTTVEPTIKTNDLIEKTNESKEEKKTLKDAINNFDETINNSAVKNYGLSLSNIITDLANLHNAKKEIKKSIPIIGNYYKAKDKVDSTVTNAATNMGIGALKTGEGVIDTLNDWSDAINNPLTYTGNKAVYGKEKADKASKENQKKQEEFIKRNLVQDFQDKTGYSDIINDLEKDSLIKQENVGGQIAQGIGGMVPALLAGQYLGFAPEMTSTKGLTGLTKAKAVAGNLAKSYASQLPSNTILGASSYGSGVEEALNEGATRGQARKFGLANTAIEQGTEYLTGGIPGLGGKGGLDDVVEPLIDKNSRGYANALLKAGYGAFGEGLEEYTSAMLDPLAKKIYSDKPIDWNETNKQALQAGLVGAATGAILNSPSSIQDIQNVRNEIKNQQAQRVQETPVQPSITQNNINTQEQVETTPTRQKNEQITPQQVQTRVEPQTIETKPVEISKVNQQIDNKQKQLEIINQNNPIQDEYHIGIRNENDIKTFDEAIQDDESFVWGDYSKEDAERDLQKGTVTVYSSKPIEQGAFVSTSQNQARDYAGGGKIYSQEVPINDVAWINGDEGQYAKVENNHIPAETSKLTQQEQQELDTLKDLPFELDEQQERRMDELLLKQNKDLEKNMSPVRNLSDVRDFNEVGSKKVNAYQYDNPEVKPYFQEVAKDMLYDLGNSTKGERYMTEDGQFKGIKRNVPNDIAELLDGENGVKYSYKEIEDGLNAIIKDNGAENKAVAKRLEFYIDQRLRNGYIDSIAGKIPVNNEYIETLRNKNTNGILYENKQENEQALKINEDGSSEIVDNKPQILEKMPQQKTKFTEKLKNWNDKIRHHFTDHQAAIYDMSREFKNPTLYHKADAIMSSDAISQNHLGKKQTNLNGKAYKNFTNENGKKVFMGFEKAYDMYSDIPTKAKNEFLVHNLNLDRLSQGVEQFENITGYESEEKINQLKEKYPDIEKWSNNIYQYYKNQLQNMVDGGLISQQLANEFQTLNPHYVRIQRDVNSKNSSMKTRDGNININNQIQKVKGSSLDILPIKETTAEYTQQVNKSIKLNQFGQELAKTIGVGSTNDNISSIDESFGINPDILSKNGKDYSFTIFNKGQATTIPINEGIYESLQNRDIRNVPILSDAVKVQRNLITNKNPYFAATNAIKDAADMFLYSKHSIPRSFATYMELFGGRTAGRAAQNIKNKTNGTDNRTKTMLWVDLYEGLGGNANSVYADGKFESNKNVVAKGIDKVLSPIEVGNEFIESMPRITEFVNTIRSNGYDINADGDLVAKKGKTPKKSVDETLNEAMYNAAEVTTNFKRGGTWAKNIDKNGGTFFNASVQGAAKLGRTFTEAFGDAKSGDFKAATRLFSRAMTLGLAPALLSAWMYKDDDDYEELPDYVKDQYYLFKTKDNNFIRIPKGRAVSLFDSASRRAIEKSQGKDDVMKGYGSLVMNQIAPSNPLDSNVFSPLVAVSSEQGKSWSGNKIVSDYLATLPKEEQYDAKTSEFSKWLGKEFKISPKKADYVIDQYSGVIGDLLLPTMTNYAESEDSSGFNALINPLKSKFTTNSTSNNKTTTEYYDLVKDINTQGNSSKATALDKAKQKYVGDYSDVKTKLSSLYAEQRAIQNSTTLSDSEKYKQNLEKQREIIELMKKTQKELKNATDEDGVISIGDKTYIETIEDGKKKIKTISSDKMNEAANLGISINDYIDIDNTISNMEADRNSNGKTIRGSKKQKVINYLQSNGYDEYQIRTILNGYGWKY